MADDNRSIDRFRVPLDKLRWHCDESLFHFETTADIEPMTGIIGQEDAVVALQYGLEVDAPGQNIFVRGLVGTGRLTLVRRLLEQIQPESSLAPDLCYVHNFDAADSPRLIALPRGSGPSFKARIQELVDFLREKLAPALSSESLRARQSALEEKLQQATEAIGKPFEEELLSKDLTIVTIQIEGDAQPAILPVIAGEPAGPDQIHKLQQEGKITAEELEKLRENVNAYNKRFQELGLQIQQLREGHRAALRGMYESEARKILQFHVRGIQTAFPQQKVKVFLGEVVEDVILRRLSGQEEGSGSERMYQVNLVMTHAKDEPCSIVVENTPTVHNLLGAIGRVLLPQGMVHSDHTMISAGSLLRASGGYLVIEARDVLSEPGAWKVLMRTLRTGKLEIVPNDSVLFGMGSHLKPEPIDVSVKVVLLGGPDLYYLLDENDPDFSNLFKVLADFDSTIERNEKSLADYSGVLARIAREEGLLPYARGGVASLAEYGARIAARSDRLTTRFGRLVDIAREASFVARKEGSASVSRENVLEAVRRARRRADLPARRFRRMVTEGAIRIQTRGKAVGQVNGLAVTQSGPLTYGFPARITATIGPGSAGTINIEREAQLSGSIHTKGFYILGGLLRHLIKVVHPLAFSASIAFEQSYGGIDGDSASGAEMCCLLSALTGIPLSQEIAMTGAIDQFGHVQAIGAVSEKVEGFFYTCQSAGLTGSQGVIIPKSNVVDLMLCMDVVEACKEGKFHVFAADSIFDALEIFTGQVAGELDEDGVYPEGSLLGVAVAKADEFWEMLSGNRLLEVTEEEEAAEEEVEEEEPEAS
ncbi:MAG: AAA family ATPase [Planctomycetota bacterium]